MSSPSLSTLEATVLRTVHAEGSVDLHDLAQAVGAGPRTTQRAIRTLSREGLVHVTDRGRCVACTREGDRVARTDRSETPQNKTGTPPQVGRPSSQRPDSNR